MRLRRKFKCFALVAGCGLLAPAAVPAQEIPLSQLADARLRAAIDTVLTYTQPNGGAIEPGRAFYIRSLSGSPDIGWEIRFEWHDSTGHLEAVQLARTMPRQLELRQERVQATHDSASLLVDGGIASGWVVATTAAPRLLSGEQVPPRYSTELLEAALAAAHPAVGSFVVAGVGALYGPTPLGVTIDTLRVSGTQSMQVGSTRVAALILTHRSGTTAWIAPSTGTVLARRGQAGPSRHWWHVLKGVTPPS